MGNARLYTSGEINRAGKVLIDPNASPEARDRAIDVFENWRTCHHYPMQWFQASLTTLTSSLGNVVQRPKRLEAVEAKLLRKPSQTMAAMNDIAGVRAIVPTMQGFDRFVAKCKAAWTHHELKRRDDYIANPRPDTGYRSLHLIYRFKCPEQASSDRRLIEVQIRTYLQHYWATAVEIVDLFTDQTLKAGQGDPSWLRFFKLMSSAIAEIEGQPLVQGTPSGLELKKELKHYAELVDVDSKMRAFGTLANTVNYQNYEQEVDNEKPALFLVQIEPVGNFKKINITGYSLRDVQQAYHAVASLERHQANTVLVSASNIDKLAEAYPNWVINTSWFLNLLRQFTGDTEDRRLRKSQ